MFPADALEYFIRYPSTEKFEQWHDGRVFQSTLTICTSEWMKEQIKEQRKKNKRGLKHKGKTFVHERVKEKIRTKIVVDFVLRYPT